MAFSAGADSECQHLVQSLSGKLSPGRAESGWLIAAVNGGISRITLQIPTSGLHTARGAASMDSSRAEILRSMS